MAVYLGSNKVAFKGGTFNTDGTSINNQNKTVTPTTSQQTITYDNGYTGLGTVTVNAIPSSYVQPVSTIGATTYRASTSNQTIASGTYHSAAATIAAVTQTNLTAANIKSGTTITISNGQSNLWSVTGTYSGSGGGSDPVIQSLSITPSTSEQTFNSSSVDGYKPVTVAAMPTMTLPTSAASSATSGYTSKATIGRSTSAQYINIPPGYNSAGAYYVISAVSNGSATAPSSISGTSATISTGTNTLTLTKTVSVTPSVTAGYVSSGTAGNSSVSLTASVTTKAAATITPGTTNQTISSGTYLTGTQTIAGDANLVSSNIVSGKSIFGVSGNVVLQNVYKGSSAPSSSTGSNGDIYLQS